MSWILIFWMLGNDGRAVSSATFQSQASCDQALASLQTATEGKAQGVCVENRPDALVAPAE